MNKLFIVLLLFVSACASKEPRSYLTFHRAVQELKERGFANSQNLFIKACEKKSQASCLLAGQIDFAQVPHKLSILQGFTTAQSTQLSIMLPKQVKAEFYLWDLKEMSLQMPTRTAQLAREHSPYAVVKATYSKLELGRSYRLDVVDDRGELLDSRLLEPLNLQSDSGRFAVASCMSDEYKVEQGPMWQSLLKEKPQVLFLIGDNVYTDIGYKRATPVDPVYMWKRYTETRSTLDLYKTPKLIPVIATWDDHDFGMNDADRRYPYKAESTEIFNAFFAQEADGDILKSGPGVSSRLSAFGVRFYLTDARTFRTPPDVPKAEQSHYGPEQTEWILSDIGARKTPVFLMQGDQFFGAYRDVESFAGSHPDDFKRFLSSLRKLPSPVFFISGDRHLTELMEVSPKDIGYKTYELTSSGIHAKTFPSLWETYPNPRQLVGADMVFNYALVESKLAGGQWVVHVTSFGPESRLLFDRELVIKR